MEVAILIGLPGAGKSSFFRARLAATHVHVSKDNFRKHRRPAVRQQQEIREALTEGRNVAVDNTNASPEERAAVIALAQEFGAPVVAYWLQTPVAECRARNAQREGAAKVPLVGIYATAKRFRPPEYAEGFDTIWCVAAEGGEFRVAPLKRAYGEMIEDTTTEQRSSEPPRSQAPEVG